MSGLGREMFGGAGVEGKIKWFSEEKGYGFIFGEDDRDYYFNIRDLTGSDLPRNGDEVRFEAGEGKKGPRATSVVISARASTDRRSDDRVTCRRCDRKMVPRMIVSNGRPHQSVCPFCGAVYKKFSPCFIATAVYGDHYAPEVIALRRFRDEALATRALGRAAVSMYYRVSPPIAAYLTRNAILGAAVRLLLNPLARRYG